MNEIYKAVIQLAIFFVRKAVSSICQTRTAQNADGIRKCENMPEERDDLLLRVRTADRDVMALESAMVGSPGLVSRCRKSISTMIEKIRIAAERCWSLSKRFRPRYFFEVIQPTVEALFRRNLIARATAVLDLIGEPDDYPGGGIVLSRVGELIVATCNGEKQLLVRTSKFISSLEILYEQSTRQPAYNL